MSLTITRRDIEEAHSYARDAISRARGVQATGQRIVGTAVKSLEVAAGAAAVGAISGRYGKVDFDLGGGKSVPLDLTAAIVGHLAAFTGMAGEASEHLHNLSDGVLAAASFRMAFNFGNKHRAQSGAKTALPSSPSVPVMAGERSYAMSGPAPLTEAELAAMAQGVRG
jgi:hypothetical protein